ncbi:MAG: hypothetical protein KZQ90_11650 [Candidatus Thiodiazotropha sp. (ex Codakia rugifera)]|nr:hypothetical protein [Candidatus Thiodiazotropha sp. (ex Codakia rugifera)]
MVEMKLHYTGETRDLVYGFFMKFSRFEFALKQSGYVYSGIRDSAQVDWKKFSQAFGGDYVADQRETLLLEKPPKKQIYTNDNISWVDFDFTTTSSDLEKLTLVLRTMRNNLFHGGKYGLKEEDVSDRIHFLLPHGIHTLERMVKLDNNVKIHFDGIY